MASERLQKIIAAAGVASRRKAEELITDGRVTVNGEVMNTLGSKADPETDDIRVDGKSLKAEQLVYILLHKPKGYVTTVTDPEGRPTVMDLVKGISARVYPVGRLDYLSEGLLLLTNDGEMAAKLTHASTHVPKKYLVKVSGQPTEEQIDELRQGVQLPPEQGNIHADPREGGRFGGEKRRSTAVKTAPCKIELTREGDNPWYEVTLTEGRNRQIRRMFDFVGHHVEKIKRVEYGPLKLDVENGEFRLLSPQEVARLKKASEGRHEPPRARDEKPRFTKSRGERPAFRAGRREDRGAFQKGSYKDRSEFENPRNERTRTARFDSEGKRQEEAPRERKPRFERSERPAFRGKRDDQRGERPSYPRRESGDRPAFRGKRDDQRGERPAFRGKRDDQRGERSAFPRRDRGDRPQFRERREGSEKGRKPFGERGGAKRTERSSFSRGSERGERPFRGKPGEKREFRGKREGGSFARGDRKPGFGRERREGGERPSRGDRFGKKPGGFRKDFRRREDEGVPEREKPRSQDYVDNVAKRFAGGLESREGRGPRGPRRGPGGAPKKPFRKPKDRR